MNTRKWIYVLIVIMIGSLVITGLTATVVGAGGKDKGKGKGKGKSKDKDWKQPGIEKKEKKDWKGVKPPGWSKGKKKGWGDSKVPPGLAKKMSDEEKEKWLKNREDAKKKAEEWVRDRDRKESSEVIGNNAESVSASVEESINAGVPADKVLDVVHGAINKDMNGEEIEQITRAVVDGVSKGVGAEEVVRFTEEALKGNVKGEDIALSVYEWVGRKLKK